MINHSYLDPTIKPPTDNGEGDNVEKVYEKGTETAADIAEKIIAHSTNKLIQKDMFEWDEPKNKTT